MISLKKFIQSLISAIFAANFMLNLPLEAATITWGNVGTDLITNANWVGGTAPTNVDTAQFTNTGNLNPTLDSSNTFIPDTFSIVSGDYEFTLSGTSTLNPGQISFSGGTSILNFTGGSVLQLDGSGDVNSTAATTQQTFNVIGDSSVIFNDNSNALSTSSTGTAVYNIGTSSGTPSNGIVEFRDSSSAGEASISVVNGSQINFYGLSTAENSLLSVGDIGNTSSQSPPNIFFGDSSTASLSSISAYSSGNVSFANSSTAASSQIYAGDSTLQTGGQVLFTGNSTAGSSSITLIESSGLSFSGNSTASSAVVLVGDGTTPGSVTFQDLSGAGSANISLDAHSSADFRDQSSAQSALINVGKISPDTPASITFSNTANAGFSTIFMVGGNPTQDFPRILFVDNSSANSSDIFLGIDSIGTIGSYGILDFRNSATAANAVITAYGPSIIVFADSSTSAQANFTLDTNSELFFTQTSDDTFYGTLNGTGTINKSGIGILSIATTSDNSGFSGITNISNGKLALQGSLGGTVNVISSGILSGIGSVIGNLNVNSSGTIAPGNSVGTITVNGNYSQNNSTYQVQVDTLGAASLINVSGTATLGANAAVQVIPLFTQLPVGDVFTAPILQANGGLTGTFSSITSTNPLVAVALSYDPNNAFLTYQNTLSANATTFNEIQVANQLVTITNPTTAELAVLTALAELPAAEQQLALDQMSAEQYTTLLITAEETNRRFIRRLYDPLRSIISKEPCNQNSCDCQETAEFWEAVSWERASYSGDGNADGFNRNGWEFSLGGQRSYGDLTLGIAASYEYDYIHYNLGGHGRNQTGMVGFYGLYRPQCFYVLSDLVLGYSQQRILRPIDIGAFHFCKRGNPSTFQGTFYGEFGVDLGCNSMLFQPFFGLELGYYHRDHIHESSVNSFMDILVQEKSRGTANSRLGVHFTTDFDCSCWSLDIDLAWQYRLTLFRDSIDAQFATFGNEFIVKGIPLSRNSVDGAINISYQMDRNWEFYLEALGQRWSNDSWYSVLVAFSILGKGKKIRIDLKSNS